MATSSRGLRGTLEFVHVICLYSNLYTYKASVCKRTIIRLHCATSKSSLWNMGYVARGGAFKCPRSYSTSRRSLNVRLRAGRVWTILPLTLGTHADLHSSASESASVRLRLGPRVRVRAHSSAFVCMCLCPWECAHIKRVL